MKNPLKYSVHKRILAHKTASQRTNRPRLSSRRPFVRNCGKSCAVNININRGHTFLTSNDIITEAMRTQDKHGPEHIHNGKIITHTERIGKSDKFINTSLTLVSKVCVYHIKLLAGINYDYHMYAKPARFSPILCA